MRPLLILALAVLTAQSAWAQRVGNPVTFTTRAAARCTGTIAAVAGDTLVVRQDAGCARGLFDAAEITEMRVMTAHRGSRAAHVLVGSLGGATIGAVAGYAVTRTDSYSVVTGDNSGLNEAIPVLGALTGGAIGAVIGLVWPAGPRWRTIAPLPIRVALLTT